MNSIFSVITCSALFFVGAPAARPIVLQVPSPNPTPIATSDQQITGDAYPWEATVTTGQLPASITSLERNLHLVQPIVAWHGNGQLVVSVALHYNSKGGQNTVLSRGWTLSLDVQATKDLETGDMSVRCGDGRQIPFIRNLDGSFSAPNGVTDRLQTSINGLLYIHANKDKYFLSQGNANTFVSTQLTDAFGNMARLVRNTLHQIESIDDGSGRIARLTYALGKLSTVTDPLGRTWGFQYAADNLVQIVQPSDGSARTYRFTYTNDNALQSLFEPSGACHTWIYDSTKGVTESVDPRGGLTRYMRGAQSLIVSNPLGRSTTYTFDITGRITSEQQPNGAITSYSWTDTNRLSRSVDARGGIEQSLWDGSGRRNTRILPDNRRLSVGYDMGGNLVSLTLASGKVLRFTYGPAGERLSETRPDGQKWSYISDVRGNVIRKVSPLGHATVVVYDATGNPTQLTDPMGSRTNAAYDILGRPISVTDAMGRITRFVYDVYGSITSIVMPGGRTWTIGYDAAGRKTRVMSPMGNVQTTIYDLCGNLTAFVDNAGNTTSFAYDSANQCVSRMDALGRMTLYERDAVGRINTLVSPLSGRKVFQWSAMNELISVSDARGKTTTASYDLCSRQIAINSSDNTVWARFTYDLDDNRTTMLDKTGSTRWLYTVNGLPYEMTSPGGSVAHTWNGESRLTATSAFGKTVRYQLDRTGNITNFLAPNNAATAVSRDAAGDLSRVAFPDGRSVEWSRDSISGDITRIQGITPSGSLDWYRDYHYNGDGLLDSVQSAIHAVSIGRDDRGNIGSVQNTGLSQERLTRSYDAIGQVAQRSGADGAFQTQFDAQGRPIQDGNWGLSYDAAGNVTRFAHTNGVQSYALTYDAIGQISGVTSQRYGVIDTINLQYSGVGQWTGSNGRLSAPLDGSMETPVASYDQPGWYSDDQLQYRVDGNGAYQYSVPDPSGNMIPVASSELAARIPYTAAGMHGAWGGREIGSSIPLTRFGHRWVFSPTGNFTSPDPIDGDVSGYSYADNDPWSGADPSGLDKLIFTPIGAGLPTKHGGVTQGNLILIDDGGKVRGRWPANSGGYRSRETKVVPGKPTRLPRGNYDVTFPRIRNTNGMVRDGFGFSFDLNPKFPTNRSDLRIHPDGGRPGTQGCLGIVGTRDELTRMYNLLANLIKQEDVDLIVR